MSQEGLGTPVTIEALSYEDLRKRIEVLPEALDPVKNILTSTAYITLHDLLSARTTVKLLRTNPEEVLRQHRELWAPSKLSRSVIDSQASKPEDIPQLEKDIEGLKKEEERLIYCVRALERDNVEPAIEYLKAAQENHIEGMREGREAGLGELNTNGDWLGNALQAAIDALESVRKH
jgi:hypothetical protein